ncbi:30S ribosomal protein S2 [Nanoarchaeota archaeon]
METDKKEEVIEKKESKKAVKKETKKTAKKEDKKTTKKEVNEDPNVGAVGSDGMLIPLEDYVKSGIYLGTKVITTDMRPYVYKRRTDGLAIINTKLIDEKIKDAINFLSHYEPGEIVAVCKREAGWKVLEAFSEATGIKVFTKKYPSGVITNTALKGFFEPSLIMVVDAWLDKNPIADANHTNIPLVAICDTNNLTSSIDLIIPGNNKSAKSIGLIFWLLARGYVQKKGLDKPIPELKDFVTE